MPTLRHGDELVQRQPEYVLVQHGAKPTTPYGRAQFSLQQLDSGPVQAPEVWVLVQSVPGFDGGHFAFEVDAAAKIEEFFDDGATGGPICVGRWCLRGECY